MKPPVDGHNREIDRWIRNQLFDEVPIAISVIGPDFSILRANRQFRRMYGPWRGRRCYQVYKQRSTPCEWCAAVETFRDGRIRTREEEGGGQSGLPSHYLVQMAPVTRRDGSVRYVIEMSTDISAVKRLEAEKREAERLAAVGQTVAGIAHGVKNVLMGLEGGMYAVSTGMERGDDERIARGWVMLSENVTRISQFIREFLDFARGREARVRLCDPNEPVRAVGRLFAERAAAAGIALEVRPEPGLAPAAIDPDAIHTCLANLVSNAIDACLATEGGRACMVTITSQEEDGVLIYEVVDNGHGMDAEITKKIFTQFFSTKGSDRGTGLGLLTTNKIVHQHGGRIECISTEGEGSCFRIELPRDALPRPLESPAVKGACGHRPRAGYSDTLLAANDAEEA